MPLKLRGNAIVRLSSTLASGSKSQMVRGVGSGGGGVR